MWQLAVDLGTTEVVAVLAQDAPGRIVEVDGAPTMPPGVYLTEEGRLLTGVQAQLRGGHDPEHYEPAPALRVRETNLLLGQGVVPVVDALAAVLSQVAETVQRQHGAQPDRVVLTVPVYWGPAEHRVLEQAAARSWHCEVRLVPAVLAAAAQCAVQFGIPATRPFAVFDLGAGGLSCGVVSAGATGMRLLAASGAAGPPIPLGRGQLPPGDVQRLLAPRLGNAVGVLANVVMMAGTNVTGVVLLGGLSRIPVVGQRVSARFPVIGVGDDSAAALGALLLPPDVSPADAVPRWQPETAPVPGPPVAVLPTEAWAQATPSGTRPDYGRPSYDLQETKRGKGSGPAVAIACGVALVLLLIAAVVVVAVTRLGPSHKVAARAPTATQAATPSGTAPPSASSSSSSSPPSSSTPVVPPPPVIAGWQTVAAPDRGAAYDVPPGWRVASQGTIGGFERKGAAPVAGKGYTSFGDGYCDQNNAKANSALTGSKEKDPAAGARDVATRWATAAFADDDTGAVPPLQTGAPQAVRTLAGQSGSLVEVTAPLTKKQPCSAPAGAMYAFATPGSGGGTFVLVVYAARGVPDEVSAAVVQQIARSVRAL